MKLVFSFIFISLVTHSAFAVAGKQHNKVFYGSDDRVLARDLNKFQDKNLITSSRAVLAQIQDWRLQAPVDGKVKMVAASFQKAYNICSHERFLDEPVVSSCSAFLIAPDIILTAGHCVESTSDCKKNKWVLDYEDGGEFAPPYSHVTFQSDKIYSCKELIASANNNRQDYALIRLDRKINDRPSLKLNTSGVLDNKASFYVVGHPLGMPKMVAKEALVRRNINDYYFVINSDTFSGNSGSPVINTQTNLVEGIIIRGEEDMVLDFENSCHTVTRCLDYECKGESVQKINQIPLVKSISK